MSGNHRWGLVGLFFVFGVTHNLHRVQGADALETYKSESGYTVQYPSSWYRQVLPGLLFIQNFSPSQAVRGAVLPRGGAGIKILIPSQIIRSGQTMPHNLDDLVTIGAAERTVTDKRDLEVDEGPRKLSVIQVKTQCCAGSANEESVDWYFQVDGHMFLASAFYLPGDPNVNTYLSTLRQVVLSLQVTNSDLKQ